MNDIIISELAIYPVKSLAQIQLQTSYVQPFGLQHDRRWMVVGNDNLFITQRQVSRMCLIQVSLVSTSLAQSASVVTGIQLSAPEMDILDVLIPAENNLRQVTVWNDVCHALDCGDEAANWLSKFLQTDCRLVYFPDNEIRHVDPAYAKAGDRTAFSDGFPLLLISQASLDDLNKRLVAPVSMSRFRPNLVVSGCEPYAEDTWKKISVGDMTFRIVKPCSRCSIPTIDPQTSEKDPQVLKTLTSYRRRDNNIYFGQNVIADGEGQISTGTSVKVLE